MHFIAILKMHNDSNIPIKKQQKSQFHMPWLTVESILHVLNTYDCVCRLCEAWG